MKKFIFGVMLLVSMLGIIGCSNPSNSDGSDGSENVVYTIKNSTGSEMTISYKNKSGEWANEKTIPVNEIYKVPASDAKIDIFEGVDFYGVMRKASILSFKVNNTELTVGTAVLEPGAKVTLNGDHPEITSLLPNK